MVYILMADGFEEIEGIMVVDLLRRARIDIKMVSIHDRLEIVSSHNVPIKTDMLISEMPEDAEMIVLPGGLKGTNNLKASEEVKNVILRQNEKGGYLAAICAAPTVYGMLGLLKGKKATCYPGLEDGLIGAEWTGDDVTVAVDGNFITSRSLATSVDFALTIIEILKDKETADKVAAGVVYRGW